MHFNSAIFLVSRQMMDIFFSAFCVQNCSYNNQSFFSLLQVILQLFLLPQCTFCASRVRSKRLQTSDSGALLFLRRCACSDLKDLTDLTPPLCSVQQFEHRSIIFCVEIDWYQVQITTSLVLHCACQPLIPAGQRPVLLRSIFK